MKKLLLVFIVCMMPYVLNAAECSRRNLTQCLDSACVVNSADPSNRCAMCGTSLAGKAGGAAQMKSLAVGLAAANRLNLKNAPTDPGRRYVWASEECLKKLPDCTAADITNTYDDLIRQSCKNAQLEGEFEKVIAAAKPKGAAACDADVQNCMNDEKRCGAGFVKCADDAELSKSLSACLVSTGCGEFTDRIKDNIKNTRDSYLSSRANSVRDVTNNYESARAVKKSSIQTACGEDKGKDSKASCILSMCEGMPNKCAEGFEKEKNYAQQLCSFVDTACGAIK